MLIAKAPALTVLIPFRDANGAMRFPVDSPDAAYPGLACPLDHSRSVSQAAIATVEAFLGLSDLKDKIEVVAAIEPVLRAEGEAPSLLYLLRPKSEFATPADSWPRIVDILRKSAPGGNRVAYNKALQYLAGAADSEVSVLEADGEVLERLRELAGQEPETML